MYIFLKSQIVKLQRVQNAAARLAMNIGKYSHVTQALQDLHWLPVHAGIDFKILILVFKVHLTPNTISPKMQPWNCSKSDLTFFHNIWNFLELQYNLKFDTLCLMTELVKGLGLFWIWRHKLFCMHVHKELMPCKGVCDVNSGIEPGPC